jgi:hypothetical protein
MPELCWICRKIVAYQEHTGSPDDLCKCLESEEPSFEQGRFDDLEEKIEELRRLIIRNDK